MSDKLHEMLSSFREDNAEKTYMEFYQYCTKTTFSSADAQDVMAMLMAWLEEQDGAIAQSFGLLMLGGLIDCGKLDPQDMAPQVADMFVRKAKAVDDFGVLDAQHHFVHFVSHFAYLAGSFCEQFKAVRAECEAVVASLLDLYLRSPESYWCAEELLVARVLLETQLSQETSKQLFSKLRPMATPQDADNWDATAAMQWQALRVVEHHKRQLVMALNVVNAEIDGGAEAAIEPLVRAHYENMFGA